jgi:hypothetical protein
MREEPLLKGLKGRAVKGYAQLISSGYCSILMVAVSIWRIRESHGSRAQSADAQGHLICLKKHNEVV